MQLEALNKEHETPIKKIKKQWWNLQNIVPIILDMAYHSSNAPYKIFFPVFLQVLQIVVHKVSSLIS